MEGSHSPPRNAFPIVGIGASAGGLEAFTQLLQRVPPDTHMAFVLIQHLDPTHPSLLGQALSKATAMPVRQAEHGMIVEPRQVYVIAPNTDVAVQEGRLVVSPRRGDGPKLHMPVDFFFRSLAAELGSGAIGIILSGSASDGTEGLRAIQAEGGITFAQAPRSARFPGMPQSAIDAGVVDHCVDIAQLADEIVRLSRHPHVQAQDALATDGDAVARDEIFARVRTAMGIDFGEFKASTMTRRLSRRMALRGVVDPPSYLKLLDAEPDEIRLLFEDMLIHVTSFFRDPEVFESLHELVFPEILEHKPAGAPLRVWVAGCSTGEEVYSIAISLLEFLDKSRAAHPIQIFGSDISEVAIQKARAGAYGESAMRDVSDERRKRYFSITDGVYRIQKSIRDLCVFVRHDLVRDPPFSKLDIVSCRNVLIYFDQALQKKVLPTLHYCLNQPGFLLLGRSENISGFSQLFSVADRANKTFLRTTTASNLRFAPRSEADPVPGRSDIAAHRAVAEHGALFSKHLDRLLLARYCPPGVLVKENMDVVLFRGQTGSYLQAASGLPQNNLLGMVRGGLIAALRDTIAQSKADMTVVRCPGVEVDQDGPTKTCDVVVVPFSGLPDSKEPLFVVLFEEADRSAAHASPPARVLDAEPRSAPGDNRRIARLEHELAATKEYLHTLIEEHGRASDELGTSNEELISGNEELQSMNEELETAKEELQSINEELTTLNDELQRRNQEVTQANSDLLNFSLTVDIPIVRLDMERRIRRFTSKARSILNVLASDIGRPIDDIKLNVVVPDLNEQISDVIESATVKETEVQDGTGRWYRMQIRPYTTANHVIDGVIISLVDIHDLKELLHSAQEARAEAEDANSAKDDFLATLSHELRTPLSSMLLNAQRLRSDEVPDAAALKRTGEALERSTWMQVKLIDDLLDVSRIVAGKLTLDRRSLDVLGPVQAALDDLAPLFAAKSLKVTQSLDATLAPIWADRVRVQQVTANLLANAAKFTPAGGSVTVALEAAGDSARLRVTDTGIGVDAAFLPHVFARFSQSDTSITRQHGGLGLGLALVRHIVELHGGTVQAQSAGAGQGSTFTVTFPFARPADGVATELAPALRSTRALDRPGKTKDYDALTDLRVLVIDDDLRTREAVNEVLQLTGAKIELAGSVAEGLAVVDRFKPQVILCDIAMPGEDGYAFVRKLRASEGESGSSIPVLALTAMAADQDRRRALAAGFQLHLAKPIDIDRLRDAVLELSKLATA